LDAPATLENVQALFWSKEYPSWRIQAAVLVRENGRRQAIAALQNGFAVDHASLGAFSLYVKEAKSFSGRIRISDGIRVDRSVGSFFYPSSCRQSAFRYSLPAPVIHLQSGEPSR
jgi:hypothetical protein